MPLAGIFSARWILSFVGYALCTDYRSHTEKVGDRQFGYANTGDDVMFIFAVSQSQPKNAKKD